MHCQYFMLTTTCTYIYITIQQVGNDLHTMKNSTWSVLTVYRLARLPGDLKVVCSCLATAFPVNLMFGISLSKYNLRGQWQGMSFSCA